MRSLLISVLVALIIVVGLVAPSQAQATNLPDSSPAAGAANLAGATSVVLALDTSDSMKGAPLLRAQEAIRQFIGKVDADTPLALVAFNNSAQIVSDFTTDRAALAKSLMDLRAEGATALYDGGVLAVALASRSTATHRVVILLTDSGDHGNRSTATRDQALTLAIAQNVTVFTIAVGDQADREFLQKLADSTKAFAYNVASLDQLGDIYTALGGQFGSSSTVTVDAGQPTNQPQDNPANNAPGGVPTQVPEVQKEPPTTTTAIVLTVDVSDSMAGLSLREAKEAVRQFVEGMDTRTPMALVSFGDRARIRQDLTVDKAALDAAIQKLNLDGVTALYDGAYVSVEIAANSGAGRKIVVLLGEGGEYGRASKNGRDAALKLAQEKGVTIYTIAIGKNADEAFLEELANGTNGLFFQVANVKDTKTVYSTLSAQLATPNDATQGGQSNTGAPGGSNAVVIAPLNSQDSQDTTSGAPGSGLGETSVGGNEPQIAPTTSAGAAAIPPLDDGVGSLGVDSQSGGTGGTGGDPANTSGGNPPSNATTEPAAVVPVNNLVKIRVTVESSVPVKSAELTINSYRLTTFSQAPFEYEFDTSGLQAGQYNLQFTMRNEQDVISTGNTDFEVVVQAQTQTATPGALGQVAQRILLINGLPAPFDFSFSAEKGLVPVVPQSTTEAEKKPESLAEILSRPASLIPAPLRDALTAQRPALWSAIMIILTLILLPQGFFTIYWMLYTWNNPDVADEYSSPRHFLPPQYSFTALLPARHEEKVLRETIKSIDAIEYPDSLKEILILIRDEDDDATIQVARDTMAELGNKPNIKLVLFKDGPKNKPNGLNKGLKVATKDVVCVFDAEDQPHGELYNVVNTVMVRDSADVVQSGVQLMNFESTWFSALNCLEYFFWFRSGLHAFTRQFRVTPLGGNTVFIKRDWLNEVEGWDLACLTEDADLGIRLTLKGAKIQIVYDAKHATQEETPHNAESFIKQRTRWVQGFFEVFRKGDWAKLPTLTQKIVALYILLNSLLQAALIIFLPVGIYVALTQRLPVPVAMFSYLPIFLLLSQAMVNLIGIREFTEAYGKRLPFLFRFKMALWYYPYQLMMAWAAFRAVRRFITNKNAWEKTAHSNLHRQAAAEQRA